MKSKYSSLKIFHHKEYLDAMGGDLHRAPLYVRIKPTNLCNHHCAYCTYGSGIVENKTKNRDMVNHTDMIPWGKLQEIIKDLGDMNVKAVTFSGGGEPLTYPHIVDAVEMLRARNIDLSLISNGQLLSGKIAELFFTAKWVRISFDSPNEAEYMKLRNVSAQAFKTVCQNLKEFALKKENECILGVNFVISKANAHRVYESAELLKNLGVNNVKFAAVVENIPNYHFGIKDNVIKQIHNAQDKLASNDFSIINNYENDWMDKNFTTKNFTRCYTCGLVTVIAADRKVYYCHTRAYDSNAIVGDLTDMSFKEMWFLPKTAERIKKLNPAKECRNFCVYEERNKLIQSYLDVDTNHINFI